MKGGQVSVMSTASIVMIIIFLLAIGAIIFLFLSRNKSLEELKVLEARKKETEARNISEHLKKVKELNLTGEAEKLFEKWRKDWDEIVETSLPGIEEAITLVEQYINKYNFSKVKLQIHLIDNMIVTTNESIDSILSEVDELVSNNKESMEAMETVNSQYRNMKKNLLAHRHSYALCEEKLEEQLDSVKEQITSFEEATEQGNYLLAKGICGKVKGATEELQQIMGEIPTLQMECQTHIPTQIRSIQDGYRHMERDGYVLQHLQLEEELTHMFGRLERSIKQLRALNIEETKIEVAFIQNRLDELCDQLEEEVRAKQLFEKELLLIRDDIHHFETEVVATKEETRLAKQSYELRDKDIEVQKNIETQLLLLRKKFETIQLQIAEQDIAFSVMREDLQGIRRQLEEMDGMYSEYVEKIHALRKDEVAAYEKLQQMKQKLLDVKRQLKNSNIPGVPSDYYELFEHSTTSMHMTYKELEKKPLDMMIVDKLLQQTVDVVETAYNEVHALIEEAYVAERIIQYGNRYRNRSNRNVQILLKAEKYFRDFKYDKAIEEASALIEENEPGAVEKLKELIG